MLLLAQNVAHAQNKISMSFRKSQKIFSGKTMWL